MSQEQVGNNSKKKTGFSLRSSDPLVIIGILILIAGAALLTYGLIPRQTPIYTLLAAGPVPLDDSQGNLIQNPEAYFMSQYNGTGAMTYVQCPISTFCYGYQFDGMGTTFDTPSAIYGGAILAAGVLSIFVGYKFEPLKPKPPHLRPITIKIEEDLCVANSVCVNLAPNVFQLKKQEIPTLVAPIVYVVDPTGADNDTIIQAAEMCPTGAIIIEDAETGERIHPPLPKG